MQPVEAGELVSVDGPAPGGEPEGRPGRCRDEPAGSWIGSVARPEEFAQLDGGVVGVLEQLERDRLGLVFVSLEFGADGGQTMALCLGIVLDEPPDLGQFGLLATLDFIAATGVI